MTAATHVHLPPRSRSYLDARRYLVLALTIAGAALFGVSYLFPYWHFALVAPQYPKGLYLDIALSGITGDVAEIDILNHYIGMRTMHDAAALESAASMYVVTAVVLGVVVGLVATGKRLGWLGLIPALGLPLGFLVDVTWWMYRFGHELHADAPLHFEPFMPVLVGAGTIGQFHTTAAPAAGFWMAVVAALLVSAAVVLRKRVCDSCVLNATCGVKCTHLLLKAPRAPEAA